MVPNDKIHVQLTSHEALKLHLEGIPVRLSRIRVDSLNRTQLAALQILVLHRMEQAFDFLLEQPLDTWRKKAQISKLMEKHAANNLTCERIQLMQVLDYHNVINEIGKEPSNKSVDRHGKIYTKIFGGTFKEYIKDARMKRLDRLRKRKAKAEAEKYKRRLHV